MTPKAYYNEFDPKAAAWLRELIKQGMIMEGDVDERSIADVRPGDLAGYTRCHFFAGIGGWELALQLAGWPDDVPVWTGSCPCQPFSAAGKGLGVKDERHLWPVFANLIAECRPNVVFGEQVASAIGHGWLDGVRADMEGKGYAVGAAVLGAHSVGAPHIRQRLYWVADAQGNGVAGRPAEVQRKNGGQKPGQGGEPVGGSGADGNWVADALLADVEFRQEDKRKAEFAGGSGAGGMADIAEHGRRQGDEDGERSDARAGTKGQLGRSAVHGNVGISGLKGLAAAQDAHWRPEQQPGEQAGNGRSGLTGGGYAGGMAYHDSQPCELQSVGREHMEPAGNEDKRPRGANRSGIGCDMWATSSRAILCRDGKYRRIPVEPAFFPLADGIPERVVRLRGYGNAIVPSVAAEFIQAWREVTQ